MIANFCLDALEAAIQDCGLPQILNTDKAVSSWHRLCRPVQEHGIQLSMDGKGACRDNLFVERLWKSVKYEEVYLHAYDSVSEAQRRLACYFTFYNQGRRIRPWTAGPPIWSTLVCSLTVRLRNVTRAEFHLTHPDSCPTLWATAGAPDGTGPDPPVRSADALSFAALAQAWTIRTPLNPGVREAQAGRCRE